TDLDWTILGPSSLTEDPGTGMIELDGERSQVTRDDVAQVAAEVLARPETIGKIINFNNGPTPIAEALGTLDYTGRQSAFTRGAVSAGSSYKPRGNCPERPRRLDAYCCGGCPPLLP